MWRTGVASKVRWAADVTADVQQWARTVYCEIGGYIACVPVRREPRSQAGVRVTGIIGEADSVSSFCCVVSVDNATQRFAAGTRGSPAAMAGTAEPLGYPTPY